MAESVLHLGKTRARKCARYRGAVHDDVAALSETDGLFRRGCRQNGLVDTLLVAHAAQVGTRLGDRIRFSTGREGVLLLQFVGIKIELAQTQLQGFIIDLPAAGPAL